MPNVAKLIKTFFICFVHIFMHFQKVIFFVFMLLSDVYLAVLWTCSFYYCFHLTWVKSIKMVFTQYIIKYEIFWNKIL